VPRPVIVVASRVAARILTMSENDVPALPTDTFTRGMGPFSATHTFTQDSTSGGPWLTKTDKVMLAPFRLGGAMTIPLVRETGWVAGS
jgi:hypothetical protein